MRKRLIEDRSKRELTQKQVAERLNISEGYVRNPGRNQMLKFETLYSVSDCELFPDLFEVVFDKFRII